MDHPGDRGAELMRKLSNALQQRERENPPPHAPQVTDDVIARALIGRPLHDRTIEPTRKAG